MSPSHKPSVARIAELVKSSDLQSFLAYGKARLDPCFAPITSLARSTACGSVSMLLVEPTPTVETWLLLSKMEDGSLTIAE